MCKVFFGFTSLWRKERNAFLRSWFRHKLSSFFSSLIFFFFADLHFHIWCWYLYKSRNKFFNLIFFLLFLSGLFPWWTFLLFLWHGLWLCRLGLLFFSWGSLRELNYLFFIWGLLGLFFLELFVWLLFLELWLFWILIEINAPCEIKLLLIIKGISASNSSYSLTRICIRFDVNWRPQLLRTRSSMTQSCRFRLPAHSAARYASVPLTSCSCGIFWALLVLFWLVRILIGPLPHSGYLPLWNPFF